MIDLARRPDRFGREPLTWFPVRRGPRVPPPGTAERDLWEAWRDVHRRGDCLAAEGRFGSSCPFCGTAPDAALVTCPGGHCGLLDEHDIGPDGTVLPSVACGYAGCSFHDYVRLVGWERRGEEPT